MNLKGKQKKNQVITANIFEQQEMVAKAEAIRNNLKASTWHELETKGKFDKNAKLTFITRALVSKEICLLPVVRSIED